MDEKEFTQHVEETRKLRKEGWVYVKMVWEDYFKEEDKEKLTKWYAERGCDVAFTKAPSLTGKRLVEVFTRPKVKVEAEGEKK